MKTALLLAAMAGLLPCQAMAQALDVQVWVQIRNGDVYVRRPQGWDRLTRDGQARAATGSRDGSLVAYVHGEGMRDGEEMNAISVCVVSAHACQVVVVPKAAPAPEDNLTGAGSPAFSYQASARPGGSVIGSLFFLTSAWAVSGAIHRVTLSPTPAVTFVTSANSLSVVQTGRFAGALTISQHVYGDQGGSCDQQRVFDPNTRTVLQDIPTADCRGLGIR